MDFCGKLPQDVVVYNILNRLDPTTWAHANLVSKSWRDVALLHPRHAQFPWLWETPNCGSTDKGTKAALLYNLHDNAIQAPSFALPPPEMGNQLSTLSSHGQYIMLRTFKRSSHISYHDLGGFYSVFLYNPFTGHVFHLPSTIRSLDGQAVISNKNFIIMDQATFSPPIATTGSPNKVDVVSVVAAYADYTDRLYVFSKKENQNHWLAVTLPAMSSINHDLIIYNGQVYFTTWLGKIMKLDNQYRPLLVFDTYEFGSHPLLKMSPFKSQSVSYYLIEFQEDLFVVIQHIWGALMDDDKPWGDTGIEYEIKRLDEEDKKLVKIYGLGDGMMFLAKGCSRSCSSSLGAGGFLSKNCIYSILNDVSCKFSNQRVVKYRLDKAKLSENSSTNFAVHHSTVLQRYPIQPKWISPYPEIQATV